MVNILILFIFSINSEIYDLFFPWLATLQMGNTLPIVLIKNDIYLD